MLDYKVLLDLHNFSKEYTNTVLKIEEGSYVITYSFTKNDWADTKISVKRTYSKDSVLIYIVTDTFGDITVDLFTEDFNGEIIEYLLF